MFGFAKDLRWAWRSLLQTPAFTGLTILILALGIGANTAIFSLVDRILLRPLPYPDSGRLVAVWEDNRRMPGNGPLSAPDFLDFQRGASQLEGIAGIRGRSLNLTGPEEPVRVAGARVSWNFFDVLRVHPALGRAFSQAEDDVNGPKATLLSHEFWVAHFGADPTLVGRSIRLDGEDYLVTGVMPPGFRFDYRMGRTDLFLPMAFAAVEREQRGHHFMSAVARLKPGASLASAALELKGLSEAIGKAYPDSNANELAHLGPLKDEVVRQAQGTLWALLGAVGFTLLIACANVMNLMLARSARRQRELAIRAALGAGRWQILRQLLTESLLLGVAGGVAGLLLARWTLVILVRVMGLGNEQLLHLNLEPRLLLFTFGLALATAALFGTLPALQFTEDRLGESLKEGVKGSGSHGQARLRGALVAAEIALATALLMGAGLMVRSMRYLQAVDPGFTPGQVLLATLTLPPYKYADNPEQGRFAQRLAQHLADNPGIVAVGSSDSPPLGGSTTTSSYGLREGTSVRESGDDALCHSVTSGYLRAAGIILLQGRDFLPLETGAALVSDSFARRHWGRESALGRQISRDPGTGPWLTIVGVVGNTSHAGLAVAPTPEFYVSTQELLTGNRAGSLMVVIRTSQGPLTVLPAVRQAIRELDPDLPLSNIRPMQELLARDREAALARSILFGCFAGLALILAGVGIYAVISVTTAQRTREIGIRMALGAQLRDVLTLVMGQGLRMVGIGLAAGLGLALALGRLVESQIHGVKPSDPGTILAVAALLAVVGGLACLFPALRAAQVNPVEALRND